MLIKKFLPKWYNYALIETIYSTLKTRFSMPNNPTILEEYKILSWRLLCGSKKSETNNAFGVHSDHIQDIAVS